MNADPRRILKKLLLPVLLAALLGAPQGGGAQGVGAGFVGAGFAGLGTSAEGFEVPLPGRRLQFPADHGAHYGYRVEWWYLTANLSDARGRVYGVQWTLFRTGLAPRAGAGWTAPQIWMGHAALTTDSRHLVAEKLARGGTGVAGVTAAPFTAWIDDWQIAGVSPARITATASGADFAYRLKLDASGPLVAQGQQGYSVKSAAGQASYYYSQPFYEVTGTLDLPEGPVEVTGRAWLDREWSSQPLGADQAGWDWFSLHLIGGEKLMVFQLRGTDAQAPGFTSGTWISARGTPTPLDADAITLTPLETGSVAGRELPLRWRIEIPSKGLDIRTRALNDDAWMDTRIPYWEGPISFQGTQGGSGYLEMTGYR